MGLPFHGGCLFPLREFFNSPLKGGVNLLSRLSVTCAESRNRVLFNNPSSVVFDLRRAPHFPAFPVTGFSSAWGMLARPPAGLLFPGGGRGAVRRNRGEAVRAGRRTSIMQIIIPVKFVNHCHEHGGCAMVRLTAFVYDK